MEGYLTEIRLFGPTWSPRNWASCSGQTMPISSFNAVFSLIGTLYGGDGRTTFMLPDLRGRTVVGAGSGIALTPRSNGQAGGTETETISVSEMPAHDHAANTSAPVVTGGSVSLNANSSTADQKDPTNNYPGGGDAFGSAPFQYATSSNTTMNPGIVNLSGLTMSAPTTILANNGSSQSHFNIQPYQVVLPIICLSGIYPSRN